MFRCNCQNPETEDRLRVNISDAGAGTRVTVYRSGEPVDSESETPDVDHSVSEAYCPRCEETAEWVDPSEEIYPNDFVVFEWKGRQRQGEVYRIKAESDRIIIQEYTESGKPKSGVVRGVERDKVELHSEGRPPVSQADS
ncbi:MAG: hypothetical protein SV253_07955 [Halobacteria archaeon]|nr:hypothetical protein [Halobacteria archaeon]